MVSVPPSVRRVPDSSAEGVNRAILERTHQRLVHYAQRLDEIEQRLRELDEEGDVERTFQATAGTVILGGLVLATADRRWALLPFAAAAFLVQHAVQGWCPPLEVVRRLRFRTRAEIERERYALKALRGDFRRLPLPHEADPWTAACEALVATR